MRWIGCTIGVVLLGLLAATPADAAGITMGWDTWATGGGNRQPANCPALVGCADETFAQLSAPGTITAAPTDGTIQSWRVGEAEALGPTSRSLSLRVLHKQATGTFDITAESAPANLSAP